MCKLPRLTSALIVSFLILSSVTGAAAKEVTPGSVQEGQAQKFFAALTGTPVACSKTLKNSENGFFCALTPRNAASFRVIVNRQAEAFKPVGPWAALTGEEGQQRSYVYKDGFMTLSYFPSSTAPEQNLWVVQYIMPED